MTGAFKANLAKGSAETLTPDQIADLAPQLPDSLRTVRSEPYRIQNTNQSTDPLLAGARFGVIARDGDKAALKTFDVATGKPSTTVALPSAIVHATIDRRWVFCGGPERDTLSFFEVDGERKLTLSLPDSANFIKRYVIAPEAVQITGDRLYFTAVESIAHRPGEFPPNPRTLIAVDAKTGKELWRHAIEGHANYPALP